MSISVSQFGLRWEYHRARREFKCIDSTRQMLKTVKINIHDVLKLTEDNLLQIFKFKIKINTDCKTCERVRCVSYTLYDTEDDDRTVAVHHRGLHILNLKII